MKLETSLIELRRVTSESAEDVEFLRSVRNSFLEKKVYADEHFIESGEHQRWFAGLHPQQDVFFIIVARNPDRRCGFLGCDQKKAPPGSAEISLYLSAQGESAFLPFHAMGLLLGFMFDEMKVGRAFGVFFKENERAIRFNTGCGFTIFEDGPRIVKTELTAEKFKAAHDKWQRFLSKGADSPSAK